MLSPRFVSVCVSGTFTILAGCDVSKEEFVAQTCEFYSACSDRAEFPSEECKGYQSEMFDACEEATLGAKDCLDAMETATCGDPLPNCEEIYDRCEIELDGPNAEYFLLLFLGF